MIDLELQRYRRVIFMKYYHGSTVKGLTELQPHLSVGAHLQEAKVYLTTSRQLAAHYIWDIQRLGIRMPMLDIRKDGTLVFQEMFSGALEYFYKGVSGYIYHCEGDYTPDPVVPTSYTSDKAVPVTGCEYIMRICRSGGLMLSGGRLSGLLKDSIWLLTAAIPAETLLWRSFRAIGKKQRCCTSIICCKV